jgi:hypothetical protein
MLLTKPIVREIYGKVMNFPIIPICITPESRANVISPMPIDALLIVALATEPIILAEKAK